MEKMRKFSEHPTRKSLNISASLSFPLPSSCYPVYTRRRSLRRVAVEVSDERTTIRKLKALRKRMDSTMSLYFDSFEIRSHALGACSISCMHCSKRQKPGFSNLSLLRRNCETNISVFFFPSSTRLRILYTFKQLLYYLTVPLLSLLAQDAKIA
jgi:hypothetical protein